MSARNTSDPRLELEQLESRELMTVSTDLGTALIQLDQETAEMMLVQSQVSSLREDVQELHIVHKGHESAAAMMQTDLFDVQEQLDSALVQHADIIATVESLTGNISALSSEQRTIEERVPAIEREIALLKEQLSQWNTTQADLQKSLEPLATRMRELREQFTQEDQTVTQHIDDVAAKKNVVDQADATLKTDQASLQTATDSLAQAQSTLKTAQETLATDQQKLSDAQTQLAKATKNYNDIYRRYGRIRFGKYPQMVKDANTAMDKAKADVDALTLTVKNDKDVVNVAKVAVNSWTKARDAAASAVTGDADLLQQAQTALESAVQALDVALAARGQTVQTIADLQPKIDDLLARIANCDRALAGTDEDLNNRDNDLTNAQTRLGEILRLLDELRVRLGEAQSAKTGLTQVTTHLRVVIDARRSAFDAAIAEIAREEGWISTKEDVLVSTEIRAQKETADVEAMQKIVSDLIQLVLLEQQAADTAFEPRVRASTILSRPSVEVIKNGDWLDLRTQGFDGRRTLTFGDTRITPQAGDHIITIPGFYAPEELRDKIPELQTMLNHQTNAMPWVEVSAPATAAADIFSPSVLGAWRAEIIATDGTATPLALTQAMSNALGTTGFTGLTPDGETGRQLTAPVPMMTITRPDGRTVRMALNSMPTGYTLYVERTFRAASRQPYKTAPITAGAFSLDLNAELQREQLGFAWTMTDPQGTIVRDGTFSVDQQMDPLMLTSIPTSPFPAGTRDLPLSLLRNGTQSPLAITAEQPEGTRPLPEGTLLVHPMQGKDIRLIFTPTGESRVMPHGTITDLDTRAGNGVTVTLTRVRADGSRDEPWTRTVENGGTLDFGSLREPFFGMGPGFSLELTISSDGDDLCDSIGVDVQFAVEFPSFATATGLPMGIVASALEGRLGSDMIILTDVFNRGPGVLTYNSSSDDIARWIVGPSYDTMDPTIKSDHRTIVDRAKAAMWQPYVDSMKTAFMDVLMEQNGVVRPRKSGGFTDPTGHSYHAAIPNPPAWGDFYAAAETQFDTCYGAYARITGDSGTLMNDERLRTQRTEQLENGLHNALRDAGLLSAQSAPPSSRSLSQQHNLDDIFTQFTGGPDRAGWTVADHENLERMVAEEGVLVASADSTGWEWVDQASGIEKATSKNTMIIVIYGSNQFPGDGISGFEKLVNDLRKNYDEVWAFSPGLNPSAGSVAFAVGPSPSEMQSAIQNFINIRLQQNKNIKNIIMSGYSWGGGVLHDISSWLSTEHPTINLAGSIYVDAVNDDYSLGAENRLPVGTHAMLNIFQSKSQASEIYLNGGRIKNASALKDFVEIDFDESDETQNHSTIDEAAVPYMIDFILQHVVKKQ